MALSAKAYRWLKDITAQHFRGEGYVIDIITPSAVRYREATRTITLSTEPLMMNDQKDKKGWVLEVYVHRPLQWDNPNQGEVADPVEEALILARVEAGLKAKVGRYQFTRI
ncbi:MAG: Imm74 family immunity protein [Terriglobales bacterium]